MKNSSLVFVYNECFLFWMLVFVMQFSSLNSFNFNVNASVELSPNFPRANSYFGYSVLLREGVKSYIVVGAPRDRNLMIPSVTDPGMIHTCDVSSLQPETRKALCSNFYVDTSANTINPSKGYQHKKDNMWLGMAIAGTDKSDGKLLMCAPRWINQMHSNFHLANGLCYFLPKNSTSHGFHSETLLPLVERENQGFQPPFESLTSYFYAYGEAGMSAKMSDDGTEFILGAPGIYAWTGSVVHYKQVRSFLYLRDQPSYNVMIPNPYYTLSLTESSYFGYSVDMGKFDTSGTRMYVAGAPRGADYKGQVLIYNHQNSATKGLLIRARFDGEIMGEYFGSSLLVIDIDGDQLDDLIVGAPLHSQKHQSDQGRVQVFMNKGKLEFEPQSSLIAGDLISGARFGSAMSNIGDINNDGFNDVAIGAPYENNSGAVYIYFGSSDGLNPIYAQKITVEGTRGFGISVSKGLDIDHNESNDIAVGAHESGKVFLFRSHLSFYVETKLSASPQEIQIDSTNFTVKICSTSTALRRRNISESLLFNVKIDEEYNRAKFSNPSDSVFVHSGGMTGERNCREIQVIMNDGMHDFSRPIDVRVDFDLEKNPMNDAIFNPNRFVLNTKTQKRHTLRVPFASGCGEDAVCQVDLKLDVQLSVESSYVIGSTKSISINITVTNQGEPAYLPTVELTPPSYAPLLRVPPKCNLQNSLLTCTLDNPLLVGTERSISIEFDTSHLRSVYKALDFNITVSSKGEELLSTDNVKNISIELLSESVVNITGEAPSDMYVYLKPNSATNDSTIISHVFEAQNMGPSPLDVFKMIFFFPIEYIDIKSNKSFPIVDVFEPTDISHEFFICRPMNGEFYTFPDKGHGIALFDDAENETNTMSTEGSGDGITETVPLTSTSFSQFTVTGDEKLSKDGFDDVQLDQFSLPIKQTEDDVYFKSQSLYINCTDKSRFKCLLVQCVGFAGLPVNTNGVHIAFKMMLNTTNIYKLFKSESSIVLATYAASRSVNDSMVYASARSLFVGLPPPPQQVSLWIFIVAIICGVLLLALISYGLYKYDFFKREKRDELQLLKNREINLGEVNDGQDSD